MAHIYMHFDFGAEEDKAQEARHKLDGWKQAFRLDKKLQYKLERPEDATEEEADADEEPSSAPKNSSKAKSKSSACWYGYISPVMKNYPRNAGLTAFPPRNPSKPLRPKSFVRVTKDLTPP